MRNHIVDHFIERPRRRRDVDGCGKSFPWLTKKFTEFSGLTPKLGVLSQQAGFFEGVFSRRIFGPLWWWWLALVYFLTVLLTTEAGQPFQRSFYGAVCFLAVATVWVASILFPKERRVRWLSRQKPVSVPLFARVGIHTIPWLGLGAVIWCALAR